MRVVARSARAVGTRLLVCARRSVVDARINVVLRIVEEGVARTAQAKRITANAEQLRPEWVASQESESELTSEL
jgi:hypothetical protein